MISFDDHIALTKALDEAKRLRAQVRKLEARLDDVTGKYNRTRSEANRLSKHCIVLTDLVKSMEENISNPAREQIATLMEQGCNNTEIIRMGYTRGSVERIRRSLRDANNRR